MSARDSSGPGAHGSVRGSVRVKFCGLTRREDVETAVALGADYLGAVFAGGPRQQTPASAAALFAGVAIPRVGVLPIGDDAVVAEAVAGVPLQIAQLHADPTQDDIARARSAGAAEVWAVVRVGPDEIPDGIEALFQAADAVVLDTKSASGLGGTGATFDWERAAAWIAPFRSHASLVLAGGLNPDNVRRGIRALQPDVVDVSSGVESARGVKDAELMRRFIDAVRDA